MLTRLLSVRIVRWELKLVYIVAAWLLGWIVVQVLHALVGQGALSTTVSNVLDLSAFVLGARIFRGKHEPVQPPRFWWRMTAWSKLSRRLGVLFAIFAVVGLANAVLVGVGIAPNSVKSTPYEYVINVGFFVTLAYLYLNSATRLKRAGIQRPEPDVKLTPKPKLD